MASTVLHLLGVHSSLVIVLSQANIFFFPSSKISCHLYHSTYENCCIGQKSHHLHPLLPFVCRTGPRYSVCCHQTPPQLKSVVSSLFAEKFSVYVPLTLTFLHTTCPGMSAFISSLCWTKYETRLMAWSQESQQSVCLPASVVRLSVCLRTSSVYLGSVSVSEVCLSVSVVCLSVCLSSLSVPRNTWTWRWQKSQ